MGESPGVLDSAEIYDVALHRFMPVASMNERRDQFAAAAFAIDKVLLVGGINTLLVPLIVFPGPAMPWVLSSGEIFSSGDGKFVSAPSMKIAARRTDADDPAKRQSFDCGRRDRRRGALRSGLQQLFGNRYDGLEPAWPHGDLVAPRRRADRRRRILETRGLRSCQWQISLRRRAQ